MEVEAGKVKIFSYEQFGNSKFGVLINQYSLVKSDLYHISGEYGTETYPVRFRIISFLGFNKVISCSSPSDGKEDSENYKKIFSKKIVDKLNDNYDEYSEKLEKESKSKLEKIPN